MKGLFFLISVIAFFSCISVSAQYSMHQAPAMKRVLPDSIDIAYNSKKNWKLAVGQIVGMNIGLWAFDRYALKANYAYISINTVENNLKNGFKWDNDQMATNMFGHPYTGSLYYNSARANGFNFWESAAFTLGGSVIWEVLLENQPPSTNDLIATSIGGIVIGEVSYSASDLVLDNRAEGTERLGREFAAFLISPTRGLTRIMNGDAWQKKPTSGRQYGIPEIRIEASTGVRTLSLGKTYWAKEMIWTTNLNVEYGDRFDTYNKQPYDYFMFRASLNAHKSQPILGRFNLTARLHGTELIDTEKDYLSLGLYQHFAYYDSDTISSESNRIPYRFSVPASFGGGLIYQNKRSASWLFDAYTHLNAVILGASLSDHYKVDMRNYNMGSGLGWQAGFNLTYKDIFGLHSTYEGYRMFTWKGYPVGIDWNTIDPNTLNVQGDKSQATLQAFSLRADVKLHRRIYFTLMSYFYSRITNYDQYEDVRAHAKEGYLMMTYRF
ncbi:DUF3943 domain-containing protein [Dysgonomonas sp. ZJ279]|uniref:DUF3943 domain-containing protein n=1 Tax=Dysgonomonas sp. ZJ279 TaxID=2709796 RepID=UPI0013EC762D|nr:DUF3943 domain-containing protein [Dysgonomonas sp. ZJ279]